MCIIVDKNRVTEIVLDKDIEVCKNLIECKGKLKTPFREFDIPKLPYTQIPKSKNSKPQSSSELGDQLVFEIGEGFVFSYLSDMFRPSEGDLYRSIIPKGSKIMVDLISLSLVGTIGERFPAIKIASKKLEITDKKLPLYYKSPDEKYVLNKVIENLRTIYKNNNIGKFIIDKTHRDPYLDKNINMDTDFDDLVLYLGTFNQLEEKIPHSILDRVVYNISHYFRYSNSK